MAFEPGWHYAKNENAMMRLTNNALAHKASFSYCSWNHCLPPLHHKIHWSFYNAITSLLPTEKTTTVRNNGLVLNKASLTFYYDRTPSL